MRRPPVIVGIIAASWLAGCGGASTDDQATWTMPLELIASGPAPGAFVDAMIEIKDFASEVIPTQVFGPSTFDDVVPYLASLRVPNDRPQGLFAFVTVTQDDCIRGSGSFNFPSLAADLKQKAAAGERWRFPIHRYDDCAAGEPAASNRTTGPD